MATPKDNRPLSCAACSDGTSLGFDFSMAFQPIVNTANSEIFSQEALVRGLQNEPPSQVFTMPNPVYRPELCIRTTLEAAQT